MGNAPMRSDEEGSFVCRRKEKGGPRRNSRETDKLLRVMKGYSVSRVPQIIQNGSSMVPGNKVETCSTVRTMQTFSTGSGENLCEKTKWREGRRWPGELDSTERQGQERNSLKIEGSIYQNKRCHCKVCKNQNPNTSRSLWNQRCE